MERTGGVGVNDRVDRVPAWLDDEVFDRERPAFDERSHRQPAAAVVARQERPHEPLLALDAGPHGGCVDRPAGRGLALHRLIDQAVFEGDAIDARHRGDPADDSAEGHRGEDRIHAPPQPVADRGIAPFGEPRDHRCDAAEVGEATEESAHAVLRHAPHPRPVVDRYLDHAMVAKRHERGDETVHVGGEMEAAGHVAADRLEAAVVIVQMESRHPADQQVEHPRGERLVPGVEPRRLPAVDQANGGVGVEHPNHPRDLGGVVLSVAVEHHHVPAAAAAKAGHQGRRLAQAGVVPFARDAVVPCRHFDDLVPGAVGRAVVDEE